jgi:Flp pilus assembly protein TadD
LEVRPDDVRVWRHRAAGAVRAGRLDEAAACYRALCRLQPGNTRAQSRLAAVYDSVGAPHAGITICQRALEQDPDAACLHRQMGRLLLRVGSVPDALRSLQRAAQLSPRHCDTQYYVGLALRRAGQMTEAREALRHALSLRPEDPKLYYALGLCCEAEDHEPECARLLLQGLAAEQLSAGIEAPAPSLR